MRRGTGVAMAAMMVAALSGCATSTEKYQAQTRSNSLALAEKGDFSAAFQVIYPELDGSPDASQKAKEVIEGNPQFKANLPAAIKAYIGNIFEPAGLSRITSFLGTIVARNLLSEADREQLYQTIDQAALDGNISGRIQWLVTDSPSSFKPLTRPDQRQIIFARSVASLRKQPPVGSRLRLGGLIDRVFMEAEKAGPGSAEMALLKAELPDLDISTQDMRSTVSRVFPQFALKEVASREVTVKIAFDDRLIEEDVLPRVRQLSPNLVVVKDGAAMVDITVKKLQWDERSAPQQTQTVTYSQSDVNILAAALLMPRNASYIYEVSSGGVQLAYAFEVKATSKKGQAFDELVRDRASREWRSCSNARIQNVFGGVQRADFVANDHMQSICGGGGSPTSPDALRSEAVGRIAAVIGKIPAVAAAVNGSPAVASAASPIRATTRSPISAAPFASSSAFTAGDRVRHSGFGVGTVRAVNGSDALVLFDGREKPASVDMSTLTKS